jgi:hypothetical protein
MNLFDLYFAMARKISRWLIARFSGSRRKDGIGNAPVLGKYADEVLNTPLTEQRTPVRSAFTKSPEYYAQMLRDAVSLYDNSPAKGDAALIYACQVHADWGLIYAGAAAVPYALEMLKSSVPEARETGASVLGFVGKDDAVVEKLLTSLAKEKETVARDSLILALGELRNRKAIPALAAIIKDTNGDGDTRHLACDSLGQIVRRRFDNEPDRLAAALHWLEKHPAE